VRKAMGKHDLRDVLVAVERTGRYHHAVKQAFSSAGFDTRVVHPFTSKQFRLAADPGVKTDDTDLAAIHRAAVNGFALGEAPRDESWAELQLLIRHRRDWVEKSSALCCQIKEHLHAALPGYARHFGSLWTHPAALKLAFQFGSAEGMSKAGLAGMIRALREQGIRFQRRSVHRALEWAHDAARGEIVGPWHCRIAAALNEDRVQKAQQIQALERLIAARLVRTRYILLLSIPGINVVSAGDFAGEAGPIEHYANSRCITGRAGLYPSRYQSDEVDHPNGPLVRCANRRLRFAILQIAGNLVRCNDHFGALAARWQEQGANARLIRVRVGQRFCRIAFHMVAGQRVFRHPCTQERHYLLDKLIGFHQAHQTPAEQLLSDLQAATDQIPSQARAAEAKPLAALLDAAQQKRRGPQMLGEILPMVLAKLMPRQLEYTESGQQDPT
jgi:transposase